MSDAVADVLDDAADYIEKHGWIRGRMRNPEGLVCALGAIGMAVGLDLDELERDDAYPDVANLPATAALARRVDPDRPFRTSTWAADSVWEFNDDQDGPQPVLDALRCAAKRERMVDL